MSDLLFPGFGWPNIDYRIGVGSDLTAGVSSDPGSAYTSSGVGSDFGDGSNALRSALHDAEMDQMIEDLLSQSANNLLLHSQWASDVSPGMATRLIYPLSHVVRSNRGYMRARDFSSHSQYRPEAFNPIPVPAEQPGSPSMGVKRANVDQVR